MRRAPLHVRVVRAAGIVCLLYGLAAVAACAFLVAVGLDLHRRLGIGDAFGAPMVLSLIPLAICYGAVIAALGWSALTASARTAAAADVLAGAYAAIGWVGLARISTDAPLTVVTALVVITLIGAGVAYLVGERLAREPSER